MLHSKQARSLLAGSVLTYDSLRDLTENLLKLLDRLIRMNPQVAANFGREMRRYILCVSDYAQHFDNLRATPNPVDWLSVTQSIPSKVDRVSSNVVVNALCNSFALCCRSRLGGTTGAS